MSCLGRLPYRTDRSKGLICHIDESSPTGGCCPAGHEARIEYTDPRSVSFQKLPRSTGYANGKFGSAHGLVEIGEAQEK